MLLAIGFVACKMGDVEDDYQTSSGGEAYLAAVSSGEFEGEWLFDEEVLDTAKLTVTNLSFEVRLPVEDLLKKYQMVIASHNIDGDPINPSNNPNTDNSIDIEYKYEPRRVILNYINQGYSTASKYCYFSQSNFSDDNIVNFLLGNVSMKYKKYGKELNYEVWYSRNQPGVAIYDLNSGLWMLKIEYKITIINYVEGSDDKLVMEFEPTELVYVTKKKI